MHKTKLWIALTEVLAVAAVALWSATATSYPVYRDPAGPSCYSCHNGFRNRGPLHDGFHQGTSSMTNACKLCHTNTGDIPKTNSSGLDANHACNGCHAGPGLRLHHANAGAPADGDGLFCADCHSDPAPDPEGTLPAYYSRTDVNVKLPCAVASGSGGEDWDGDGKGLDNDGDLAYDMDDPDCGPVPARMSTWGLLKAIYR